MIGQHLTILAVDAPQKHHKENALHCMLNQRALSRHERAISTYKIEISFV